ncbi:MAG: B12-binding domain-containing radical SAM protein [Elusimicrobiales bacterium]|nr:B12-binding domain-containing radical SAM protein [Elusimicrobiales bacterium]
MTVMPEADLDILLAAESDHFMPGRAAGANAFSPVYEYLGRPLRELGLPFQYTLNSPQRLTLAGLAGYLSGAGLSCAVADNVLRDETAAARFRTLLSRRPRVVGISVSSLHKPESVEKIAAAARAVSPGSLVVVGGCGLDFNPELAAPADAAISGDGELALETLAKAAAAGAGAKDLPRIFPSAVKGPGRALLIDGTRNLALSCPPAWGLYGELPSACFPVAASKGCAHSCVFCSYPERGKQEYRPVQGVMAELRALVRNYGARYVRFVDTNLTSDPAYVAELCRLMTSERLGLSWSCFARADELAAGPGLCARMAEAGCFWVYSGAESYEPGILAAMNKGFGPEALARSVKNVQAAGMAYHSNFVTGFPGETPDTLKRTLSEIISSGMDTVSFTVLGLTAGLEAAAAAAPEKLGGLARGAGGKWRHATMDLDAAQKATGEMIRTLALTPGAPLIASHGIGMYYLLGGGAGFGEVLRYFSAVRDYQAAGYAGLPAPAASAAVIREICSRTSARFGWREAS